MRVLFDHCVPRRFRTYLVGHEIKTTYEQGRAAYKNGNLLSAAESSAFAVLLTVDQNTGHQQNMNGRSIAILIVVAASNRLDDLVPLAPAVMVALDTVSPGQIIRVELPATDVADVHP